ncbi:S41 family peptidase [Xanthocytophaga flava]|uniref:S41 family peptidase n=1 Tax=Xanthocytophaga flava TaxID=3048013 RepID=UPI0028CFE6F9|nr:S41 family peptidase [Xanthocytophaga flavus]MDJ1471937.1 S41 family peptidase [Xanthocytophaga flavus]
MKSTVIFILLYSFPLLLLSQTPSNHKNILQKDFQLLRTTLEQKYPSLYRYVDKKTLTSLFDSCYNSIQKTTTNIEFYRLIKLYLSTIKDGHLSSGLSPDLKEYIHNQAKFFPIRLYFTNNHAFILKSDNPTLPAGAEIIAIDKRPIGQIQKNLFGFIVSDGSIETKKYHILNNVFHFYYLLAYGEHSRFEITYQSKSGKQQSITLEAVFEKDIPQLPIQAEPQKLLSLSIDTNQIALITIKTFSRLELEEANENFEDFLRSSFEQINQRQIKKLIIDLRDNGGGRDLYGSLLYSYLTSKKIPYYKQLETSTDSLPFEKFARSFTSFNGLTHEMLEKVTTKRFRLKKEAHTNLSHVSPNPNKYTGQVVFLINGQSFSTTAEFCAIAKSHNRGKFIGEETGGGVDGNTSGVLTELLLPNTQIPIIFGLVQYDLATTPKLKGRGTLPDYTIHPTVQDILLGNDVQLSFAKALVLKK